MRQTPKEVWKESRTWWRTMTSDLMLEPGAPRKGLLSLEGLEDVERSSTFSDSQPGRHASSACGSGEQGLGESWRSPSSPFPLPLPFPICSVCALLSYPTELCGKKTLHQQQQDNKGHVNERTGGGRGKGDFGSNNPSSRASVLPSTPSFLNQMGLNIGARGSHRDHPI